MDEDMRWRAEDDLRTLVEAEKIRGDSKRLKAAMAMRKEKMAAMKSLDSDDGDGDD